MNSGIIIRHYYVSRLAYLRLYLVCTSLTARRPAYSNYTVQMRLTACIPYPAMYSTWPKKNRRLSIHRLRTELSSCYRLVGPRGCVWTRGRPPAAIRTGRNGHIRVGSLKI